MGEPQISSILLVEDELPYGEIVERLHATVHKKFYGECKMHVRTSWAAALEFLASNQPDVLVLDLILPPMGQSDTLDELRRLRKHLPPVLVLTNSVDPECRRKCFAAGADSFMFKTEANRNPELLCERIYNCFLRRLAREAFLNEERNGA